MPRPVLASLRRLEWRLPAVIAGLLLVVVSVVSWIAYGTLRQAMLEAAGMRLENVAGQLASMLTGNVEGFVGRAEAAAADERLAAALAEPSPAALARAGDLLDSLAGSAARVVRIELYDSRERLLAAGLPEPTQPAPPPWQPTFAGPGPASRVSGFRPYGDALAYAAAVSVPDQTSPTGTLVYHFVLRGSGGEAARIAELIGPGAALRLGVPGGTWTDLEHEVPPPPSDVAHLSAAARYRPAAGGTILGAGAPVPGTPWVARVELPQSAVLAPAWAALLRMLPLGGLIVLVGSVIGWTFGRGIAVRLRRLTEALTAVASGRAHEPLAAAGSDELAEAARAFHAMAAEIEAARTRLEHQVAARTAALSKSEERFRTLATVAPDAIVTAGPDGRIVYVNPGAERMFGYSADTLIGSEMTRVLPDLDDVVRNGDGASPDDAELEAHRTVELSARRADGSGFPVELSLATSARPDRPAFTALIRDITRRRGIEEAMARYAAGLEAANAELEAFSYSVSHDLRAPLRAIHGFSQAVIEEHGPDLPARGRDDLRRVCAAAEHMSRLIDDLLELSRATRAEMREEEVDLGALAREILDELAAAEPERRVDVQVAPDLRARGDRRLLEHVLRNLLENAWKFTSRREHASIEVGRALDGERPFFVRDDGAGFDPAYADKLFTAFQRLHAPRDFAGTGIGLALVARIVRRHGGSVAAEGRLDGGATFSFTLPGS